MSKNNKPSKEAKQAVKDIRLAFKIAGGMGDDDMAEIIQVAIDSAHAPAPQPGAVEELLEAAEEYAKGGPTSADMRMLIIAIGGVTPNAKKAMELYDSLDEKRDRLMRAASAVRAATATATRETEGEG